MNSIYLLAGICIALGQSQAQDMLQADRAFVQAVAQADKHALEKLLDANFTWINAAGLAQTKAQVLRNLPSAEIPNESAAQLKTYTYGEIGDVQANLDRAHVLRVWVKRARAWKAIVYQEVQSLDAPPSFAPSASPDCENPCKTVPYQPKNETEQQVITAYSRLETAAMAHNSARSSPRLWAMNSSPPAPIATNSPASALAWTTSTIRRTPASLPRRSPPPACSISPMPS
jgi:hypothetical protein